MANDNPSFNLLEGVDDTWAKMSPDDQLAYLSNDPHFGRALFEGQAEARAIFDTATRRHSQWKEQQRARELQEATKAHEEWMKATVEGKPYEPKPDAQAELDKLVADKGWRDKYENGDLEARRQFDEATRKVANQPRPSGG